MSENHRVVVTGLGAVTSLGNNVADSWQGLLNGCSGIGVITQFDASDYKCRIAGEVKGLDVAVLLGDKEAHRMDRFCQFAVVAAEEAILQSGVKDAANFDCLRAGVLVSAGIGGITTMTEQTAVLLKDGPGRVSPLTVPMMIADMGSGYLAIRHGFRGPNFGIVSACASGLHSIGEAFWMICRGDADVMLCGGAEAGVVTLGQAGFSTMRALCTSHNDDPEHACRPFDASRDGFVPAEGAGVLVLEDEAHARARGAEILAEVVGYGLSGDAYHITAPRTDGSGAAQAIRMAFAHSGRSIEELDYVNAHGTSTPLNDKMETAALKDVLGEKAYHVPVSSTKSMTGHMLGAAGGFESIVCVKAICEGIVPGTMNYENPDPDCDLDYVPNCARERKVKLALKTNFGFGGHNAAVLFAKYESR
ncbi:MAG: beta-ketoacyl-ACP synthase II [Victivallales bacterium]|nr:beta-ketoacyl-ACP synthase II [Victivallales bacterium]